MNKKMVTLSVALGAAFSILVIGLIWWSVSSKEGLLEGKGDDSMSSYVGHGGTFKNTIVDMDTPDPSVVYRSGYYYMTFTHNGTDIMVMKSRTIDFRKAERKVVWYPPFGTMYSANLWAPELQYIDGKWYIYFAADDGLNENHRMYALEAVSDDPLGDYEFRGKIDDGSDKWAIDGLVMEHAEQLYFVWSGWEGDVNISQNTYIAPMSDPLTISGERVLISEPREEWERAGGPPYIQEGQAILKHNGRLFIAYSGAGSWTPFYSIGLLELQEGGDPLQPQHWTKLDGPFMTMDEEAGVYGPGHNSFTHSPDGTETWIVYHATSGMQDGWNNRKARAQKVEWNEQGMPTFGQPLSTETAITVPSAEGVYRAEHAAIDGATLTFDLLHASVAGEMPVMIHYNSVDQSGEISIGVNGTDWGMVEVAQTISGDVGYAWVSLPFEAGMNTVSLTSAARVSVEAIELTRYEVENGQAKNDVLVENNPFSSGWGIVLGSGNGGAVEISNITVPESGTYQLRLSVSNRGSADYQLAVELNGKKAATLTVPPGEREKFPVFTTEVKLVKGANQIYLKDFPQSIAIDYVDVLR